MMNTILSIVTKEIKNQKSCFVFPSETASSRWGQQICGFTGERSIALNRFLAWDRFKEQIIRSEIQDKEPISSIVRKLFAEALIRKNAEAASSGKEPLFRSLIPPEYADGGRIFSDFIGTLLPSLGFWEARRRDTDSAADDEDRDFVFLKNEYAGFLAANNLFEPSWEKPPLRDKEHKYYIFFPEAIEDFAEYESLLNAEPSIRIVYIEEGNAPLELCRFGSVRAEIRSAILEIRRFHEEEKIPYEDMAVSMPDFEEAEPYLIRELALYNIPVSRRSGKYLADFGTGKLFSLINSCAANNFSFPALKSLLLNEQIPWRFPQWNKDLIDFGIQNNCVSPYREKGRPVDIWQEAFRNFPREERLYRYYQTLKDNLSAITAARSFSEIRRRYFVFRGRFWEKSPPGSRGQFPGFLSRDSCSDEGDAVLARCIEELSSLIQLEADYPDFMPDSPFAFYLALLKEKRYVPQQPQPGVNIFPYRVAAAAPFACHFVLNASQGAATVLYQPLKFLRQDKRRRLGVSDTDASAAFFSLYRSDLPGGSGSHLRFSASERTFSGWAIPHSFFSGRVVSAPAALEDSFLEEQAWWADGDAGTAREERIQFPARIFSAQKEGFDRWSAALSAGEGEKYCLFNGPFPRDAVFAESLWKKIQEMQEHGQAGEAEACLKVSATDLNAFFFCPVFWLYRKIWAIAPFVPDAKLLDDASLGLLYHAILKKLFAKIREEDRVFIPGHRELYYEWVDRYTGEVVREYPAFQGPLAVPLLVSQSNAIARRLRLLLKTETEYFSEYAVADLEMPLEFIRGDTLLNGRLDRVSIAPGSVPVIIDYKTGRPPSRDESTFTEISGLRDFQMPMYVRLYEERAKQKIGGAFFVSINQRDICAVIGSPNRKRGHSREAYQPTLDAFDGYVEEFRAALKSLDFSPGEIKPSGCFDCDYRNICRTVFSLNADTGEARHGD